MISFWWLLLTLCGWATTTSSFVVPSQSTIRQSLSLASTNDHEEYSLQTPSIQKTEYAAISPGSIVRIQVGDVSLARKAWKKRRRSGSPLLIPCSILDVDRKTMVRQNILYLLQKFGTPLDSLEEGATGFLGSSGDLALRMSEISRLYQSHLGTSLATHARALGHESARGLVRDLFNRQVQKDYGIRMWLPPTEESDPVDIEKDTRPLYLMVPLSRQRAHRMAAKAGLLQFTSESEPQEDEDNNEASRMHHTGVMRIRNKSQKKRPHTFLPLSAALRVNQRDLDSGIIHNGSILTAVAFSLDLQGDGGSPLLTLSMHKTRGQVRDRLKLKAAGRRHYSRDKRSDVVHPQDLQRRLEDLNVGDGPLEASVVHMSTRLGAAFVDCGVGRTAHGKELTRVLGMLRFDDLVQSRLGHGTGAAPLLVEGRSTMSEEEADFIESAMYDEEDYDEEMMTKDGLILDVDGNDEEYALEEGDEDITHLVSINENGEMLYTDPDTGDTTVISHTHDHDDDDDDEEEYTLEEGDEDITHLVSLNEDGEMVFTDPDTQETTIINHDHDHDDDDEDDDEEDDLFAGLNPEERLARLGEILGSGEGNDSEIDMEEEFGDYDEEEEGEEPSIGESTLSDSFAPSFVQVGDKVEVYVKSVLKQSGRFMVTIDSSVKGRRARDMKKESENEKKLARLVEIMGGEEGFQRILGLAGTECDGLVKAVSKTGDWFYVQPSLENLPVGVAVLSEEAAADSIEEGGMVRVRFDGIDDSRGQVALTILS